VLYVGIEFFATAAGGVIGYTQLLWTWISGQLQAPAFGLHLDGLSLTMLGVVTGVGFLIHLFASWYMRGEEGYSRFFAYMNLFVASMLCLVLGDNLLLLYLGWEGVGLCSYLLIGFYYKEPANGAAAQKAFIVTRVGDVFMAIGCSSLYRAVRHAGYPGTAGPAPQVWQSGGAAMDAGGAAAAGRRRRQVGTVAAADLAGRRHGRADAGFGADPRRHHGDGRCLPDCPHPWLFLLAPDVLNWWAGRAVTLLLAGFAALVQTDIKRILAYSTMSQIGYMFLALGVGAWNAAIFHLMTHAFFKALLFLSAGAVIIACHHEQNIFKMGGLRKKLPLVYAAFLVGGSALAALPLVTAGFYSKDAILWGTGTIDRPTLAECLGLRLALRQAVRQTLCLAGPPASQ
jgi:NADH-quinone oxidoreductase subunit L